MLHPMETMAAVLLAREQDKAGITLLQIEGFTRWIIGWRECMRGVDRAQTPDNEKMNDVAI